MFGEVLKDVTVGDIINLTYHDSILEKFIVLGKNVNPNPDENVDYEFIDVMCKVLLNRMPWKVNLDDEEGFDNPNYKLLNFIDSDIMKELHSFLDLFPKEVQDIIIPKKARFLSGINYENNERIYRTMDMGKIWCPSVKEIVNYCDKSDADPEAEQYPYFEDIKNRKNANGGYWTCSALAFDDRMSYCISSVGIASTWSAIYKWYVPLCIRLKM